MDSIHGLKRWPRENLYHPETQEILAAPQGEGTGFAVSVSDGDRRTEGGASAVTTSVTERSVQEQLNHWDSWLDLNKNKSILGNIQAPAQGKQKIKEYASAMTTQEAYFLQTQARNVLLKERVSDELRASMVLTRFVSDNLKQNQLFLAAKLFPRLCKRLDAFLFTGIEAKVSSYCSPSPWLALVQKAANTLVTCPVDRLHEKNWDAQIASVEKLLLKLEPYESTSLSGDAAFNKDFTKDIMGIRTRLNIRLKELRMNRDADFRRGAFIQKMITPVVQAAHQVIETYRPVDSDSGSGDDSPAMSLEAKFQSQTSEETTDSTNTLLPVHNREISTDSTGSSIQRDIELFQISSSSDDELFIDELKQEMPITPKATRLPSEGTFFPSSTVGSVSSTTTVISDGSEAVVAPDEQMLADVRTKQHEVIDQYYQKFLQSYSADELFSNPQKIIAGFTENLKQLLKPVGRVDKLFSQCYREQLRSVNWDRIEQKFMVRYGLNCIEVLSSFIPANLLNVGNYQPGEGVASIYRSEDRHACNLNRSELHITTEGQHTEAFVGLHSSSCCAFGIEDEGERQKASQQRAGEILQAAAQRYIETLPLSQQALLASGNDMYSELAVPVLVMSLMSPDSIRKLTRRGHLTGFSQDEKTMLQESFAALGAVADRAKSGFKVNINGKEVTLKIDFDLVNLSLGVNEFASGFVGAVSGTSSNSQTYNDPGIKKLFDNTGLFTTRLAEVPDGPRKQYLEKLYSYAKFLYDQGFHTKSTKYAFRLPEALAMLAWELNVVPYWFCKSGTDRTLDMALHVRRFACDIAAELAPNPISSHWQPSSENAYKTFFLLGGVQPLQGNNRGTAGFKSRPRFAKLCPKLEAEAKYKASMIH